MKRVLVAAVAVLALASCKKEYTCTYDVLGTSSTVEYGKLSSSEADAAKPGCDLLGGTFESK